MRKFGVLTVLFLAILIHHMWPGYKRHLSCAWESVRPLILDGMNALIKANSRIMSPLLQFVHLKFPESSSDDETGSAFKPPRCLRNPIALDRLEKHKHLAVLGHVFDVSSNPQIYGVDGIYAFLTGRDATRIIVSESMKDEGSEAYALDGLTSTSLYELGDWLKIYSRKYPCVGYIPSVYYSPMGDASDLLVGLLEAWNKQPSESLDFINLLPSCNSFFDGKMLRLTCGLYNSVTGEEVYPRQLLEPEKAKMRCVCVPKSHLTLSRLRRYPGCSDLADHCLLKVEDAESIWTGRLTAIEVI